MSIRNLSFGKNEGVMELLKVNSMQQDIYSIKVLPINLC